MRSILAHSHRIYNMPMYVYICKYYLQISRVAQLRSVSVVEVVLSLMAIISHLGRSRGRRKLQYTRAGGS